MLGHDLRNPLAAILTSARLAVRRGGLPVGEQKTIARIVSSGERMERMIDQILDMTRARQRGGIPLRREPKDVSLSVVKAVEEARAGHAEAVLEVEVAPDGRLVASIDADRVEQVLSNLIGNAIVHSPAGRPVRIAVRSDAAFVVVTVHNEGPPILEELQRTLFDPFTRAHSPKQERSRGLGLGLYIAEHIVRAHGGAIALESTVEYGTTFAFTMPRASAGDKDAYVLVVEDDQDLRETTQEVLELAGFKTAAAQDGAHALRILADRGMPDLILLDLVMPVMDGWTLLSRLRSEPTYAQVPVIVTTSATSRAPSGVLVLKKPVTPESLEQHVRRYMRAS
jgi:CheY-like chemotaxis protein